MGMIRVDAERTIAAPPAEVYRRIADYRTERPRWLPPNFSAYQVDSGGQGAGTSVSYLLTVGRRARTYHLDVTEPEPGAVLVEKDRGSTLTTTWMVRPQGGGSRVSVHTEWQGHGGIGGFFERLFAPAALRRVYDDVLGRLERQAASAAAQS